MATQDRVIDLERTYIPMDPNGFPETMHATGEEDAPEARIPVICYDGYNFLPTQYGYASFFGVNSKLDITDLDSRVDDLFIVQTETLSNILVALAEDGIWTKVGSTSGAWSHIITLAIPSGTDVHLNWSKCVIGNEIILYRQGEEHVWRMHAANSFVPTEATPTFLNMEGQLGIFKAGGRLGFWDSDGSIGWSDVDDLTDFTPSIETGAGNTKFQQIHGKIVTVRQHGTGFIIYCTKSVVLVARGSDANFFWISEAVFTGNGISYKDQVAVGQPDTVHFVYTTFGFAKIENGKAEYVLAEVFSYVKEKKEPVFLQVLEGRFLFLSIISADLIFPEVGFIDVPVPETVITFQEGSEGAAAPEDGLDNAILGGNNQEGTYLYRVNGFTTRTQASTENSVPIWEDHISTVFQMEKILAWKNYSGATFGSRAYFDGLTFNAGIGITRIDGSGTEYFIPSVVPKVPETTAYEYTEDNTFNFFWKQEMAWYAEDKMFVDFKESIIQKSHLTYSIPFVDGPAYSSAAITDAFGDIENTERTLGTYVDPSFVTESNRYYGFPSEGSPQAFSAWLQRSLMVDCIVKVTETTTVVNGTSVELGWIRVTSTNGGPNCPTGYSSYAGIPSAGTLGGILAFSSGSSNYTYPNLIKTESASPQRQVVFTGTVYLNDVDSGSPVNISFLPYDSALSATVTINFETPSIGTPVYKTIRTQEQTFGIPFFEATDYNVCENKELGFTKVRAKGHYTDGVRIEDAAVPGARTEENALTVLLGLFNVSTEAEMWAAFGNSDKPTFIAHFNSIASTSFSTYVELADYGSPGWDISLPSAEAVDYNDQCDMSLSEHGATFNGTSIAVPTPFSMDNRTAPVTIGGVEFASPEFAVLPASSFLLQDGSIEPIYPTFAGAFVYDIQYKKWGKMGLDYKVLLDYSPLNSEAGDKRITSDIFGVFSGAMLATKKIALFDKFPDASLMRYGKIGYYRHGFTDCEGVELQFRNSSTGSITVEGSIDGKNLDSRVSTAINFANTNIVNEGFSLSAKWFNVAIQGIFDLKHLVFLGRKKGRR